MSLVSLRAARRALLPDRVVLTVVLGTIAALLVQTPVAIPLSRSAERLWPLGCLAAVPAAVWLHEVGDRWLEVAAGAGSWVRWRLVVAMSMLVLVGALAGSAFAATMHHEAIHGAEVVRNFGFVAGLTLLAGRTRLADVLWAPAIAVVLGCWLIGAAVPGEAPAPWAITLLPITDPIATTVSVASAILGLGAYVQPFSVPISRSACSP